MQKSPPPFIWAVPEEKNILDCEYEVEVRLWAVVMGVLLTRRALHHCELAQVSTSALD